MRVTYQIDAFLATALGFPRVTSISSNISSKNDRDLGSRVVPFNRRSDQSGRAYYLRYIIISYRSKLSLTHPSFHPYIQLSIYSYVHALSNDCFPMDFHLQAREELENDRSRMREEMRLFETKVRHLVQVNP